MSPVSSHALSPGSEALTEDALKRWDLLKATPSSVDPPGLSSGMLGSRTDLYAHDGWWNHLKEGSSSSEDQDTNQDDSGDDEDDGLFIGCNAEEDDGSEIAFSDIVLPTEDQDHPMMTDDIHVGATKNVVEDDDFVVNRRPRPVTFSAHSVVSQAIAKKRPSLLKLTQKELLERLEQRLRPYMLEKLKLPPLRPRKRPNCLFLNHMGTRHDPKLAKKRKVETKVAVSDASPAKKQCLSAVPKKQQNECASPCSVRKPPVVVAPSPTPPETSPQPARPVLPKLLTDDQWGDDLKKEEDQPASLPPLVPTVQKTVRAMESTKKQARCDEEEEKSKLAALKDMAAMKLVDVKAAVQKTNVYKKIGSVGAPATPVKKATKMTKAKLTLRKNAQADPPGMSIREAKKARQVHHDVPASIITLSPDNSSISSKSEQLDHKRDVEDGGDVSILSFHDPLPLHDESLSHFLADHDLTIEILSPPVSPDKSTTSDKDGEAPKDPPATVQDNESVPSSPQPLHTMSFVPIDGKAVSHDGDDVSPPNDKPQRVPRRVPNPRPMLLSPEMDMFSPTMRYTSHGAFDLSTEDHPSPNSPPTGARRIVSVNSEGPDMPLRTARMYPVHRQRMPYYRRRPSIPYRAVPLQYSPAVTQKRGAVFITPDNNMTSTEPVRNNKMKELDLKDQARLQPPLSSSFINDETESYAHSHHGHAKPHHYKPSQGAIVRRSAARLAPKQVSPKEGRGTAKAKKDVSCPTTPRGKDTKSMSSKERSVYEDMRKTLCVIPTGSKTPPPPPSEPEMPTTPTKPRLQAAV